MNSTRLLASGMLFILIFSMILCFVALGTGFAYADDIGDDIASGINEVLASVKKIVNPIAVLSLVICGIYVASNTDAQTIKRVKTWIWCIFIGLILVNFSGRIIDWMSSIGA